MHKRETCLMCMDLLDQFKKIACIGLNYGKQIEEKGNWQSGRHVHGN